MHPLSPSLFQQRDQWCMCSCQVSELVDDIWYAAGDKSTDYNWYTKRALLAAVYSATELYMLTDYSPGYADTWEALDRRLQDVARLGKATGQVRAAHLGFRGFWGTCVPCP